MITHQKLRPVLIHNIFLANDQDRATNGVEVQLSCLHLLGVHFMDEIEFDVTANAMQGHGIVGVTTHIRRQ